MDTAAFLTELYGRVQYGYVEIRCLHKSKDRALTQRLWKQMPFEGINPRGIDHLLELNQTGLNIYHRIAISDIRKARKANVCALPALWVDIDDNSPESFDRLLNLYWMPSIIVASGGGYHGYWTFDEPLLITPQNIHSIERTLQGMAFAVGGDPVVKDITRILRTPGTYNVKDEYGDTPPLCQVIAFEPCWFEFQWLYERYAPLAPEREQPQVTRAIPVIASEGIPKWIQRYLDTGAPVGERNHRAYVAARGLFDNGYSVTEARQIVGSRASADGLPEHEIDTLITSAANAPRGVPNMPDYMTQRMAASDRVLKARGA